MPSNQMAEVTEHRLCDIWSPTVVKFSWFTQTNTNWTFHFFNNKGRVEASLKCEACSFVAPWCRKSQLVTSNVVRSPHRCSWRTLMPTAGGKVGQPTAGQAVETSGSVGLIPWLLNLIQSLKWSQENALLLIGRGYIQDFLYVYMHLFTIFHYHGSQKHL